MYLYLDPFERKNGSAFFGADLHNLAKLSGA